MILNGIKLNRSEIHMLHKLDKSGQIWCGVSSLGGGGGDPSCYFRLAAACPDRGVMGGKEGGGIFWTKNKIGFYLFSFREGGYPRLQASFFSS